MPERDDFYVGYHAELPAAEGARMRAVIPGLYVLAGVLAALLLVAQGAFGPSRFEFGNVREFEGVLSSWPHPSLQVERPGETGAVPEVSQFHLVAEGKFGAGPQTEAFDGHRVRLRGTLIYRDDQTMIELSSDSIEDLGPAAARAERPPERFGRHRIVGEIVDSKCYLGVMNPGNLKAHKACAVRCISGGVPPVLLVRSEDGSSRYLLLVDEEGAAVNDRVLDLVAEPIALEGELERHDNLWVFKADLGSVEHLAALPDPTQNPAVRAAR